MELTDISQEQRLINTRELCLRPLTMTDAKALYPILADPESMKYWSGKPATDISEAVKTLREYLESDSKGNSISWAVTRKDHDLMIGKCTLFHFSPANRRAEIAFLLNRGYWRQGLMHQTLEAVIAYAFDTLNLHRIEADADTGNAGSLALLEKLGFEREGLFRERWYVNDEWGDSVMLALLNKRPA